MERIRVWKTYLLFPKAVSINLHKILLETWMVEKCKKYCVEVGVREMAPSITYPGCSEGDFCAEQQRVGMKKHCCHPA